MKREYTVSVAAYEKRLDAWRERAARHLATRGDHDTVADAREGVSRCAGCAALAIQKSRLAGAR